MDPGSPTPVTAGPSTLVSIVAAPGEAFESIRQRPVWGWAFAATVVLAAAGSLLGTPAALHMLDVSLPAQLAADPRIAGMPPDQAQQHIAHAVAMGKQIASFTWALAVVYVPIAILIETAVVFAVLAAARAGVKFRQTLALTAHVQFISLGMGSLIQGIVVALRPIESIRSQADFLGSVPSLAWFASGAPVKVVALLAGLGPFSIWGTILLALGMTGVGRLAPALAWTASIGITLAGVALSAAFIR